jgi:hypothetical protein
VLERQIQEDIRSALSRGDTRLFRQNVGTGWAGGGGGRKATRVTPDNIHRLRAELRPGDVVVPFARPLHAGLQEGSGDLIGWESRLITPAMVGQRLAVFASVEVKAPEGRARAAQLNWAEQVRAAGGIAGFARSEAEARELFRLA